MVGSVLGFGALSMTDRHGQDSLPAFVEHFNVLIEAASASAQGRWAEGVDIMPALNPVPPSA
jgi:hypothetical protein